MGLLEKKKAQMTFNNMNFCKKSKNKKCSIGLVVTANRTITNFKSIGKQVEVIPKIA